MLGSGGGAGAAALATGGGSAGGGATGAGGLAAIGASAPHPEPVAPKSPSARAEQRRMRPSTAAELSPSLAATKRLRTKTSTRPCALPFPPFRRDAALPLGYTSAMPVAWSRPEPFGAWIRLGDETLAAVDPSLAARLGVPHGRALGLATRPLELHIAVTTRCPAPCTGCYLDARPDGEEPSFEALAARLAEAAAAGVSTVAFGGGEPLTRGDLGALAAEARRLGLVPVLTTSGIGLTAERARELRGFAQINVSHDGAGEGYEAVRGFDGRGHAERAIRWLVDAGIPTGVNVVLTRASLPLLAATCALAADLGAGEVQLLRYKPAGRADDPGYDDRRLPPDGVRALWPAIAAIVAAKRVHLRIDCAMVPLLSEGLLAAVPDAPAALEALGVFGCEAARHLGAMRADGSLAGCSFFSLAKTGEPIAIGRGNARDRDVAAAWDEAPDLARLRAYHEAPPDPCRTCPLFRVCRGGCQIVSRRERGAFAPDPECPRVRAHASALAAGTLDAGAR
jgi:radical SAM protein with 4Fe4S-binding SPASM domain